VLISQEDFSFRLKWRGPVWQASFANHGLRDRDDYERHREYIQMNPVRARLAERAEEYRYSSWRWCCGLPRFHGG